jgi:hypothetical protein
MPIGLRSLISSMRYCVIRTASGKAALRILVVRVGFRLSETLVKKAPSNEMAIINIESNASDGEIECLRVAFNRHCPVLDNLSKSLTVEL